jgi:CRP-like cAMP-binding protein
LIFKGSCEAFIENGKGSKITFDTLKPGDYFGEYLVFDKLSENKPLPFSVRALEDVEIGIVPAKDLQFILYETLRMQQRTIDARNSEEIQYRKYETEKKLEWIRDKRRDLSAWMKEQEGNKLKQIDALQRYVKKYELY